MTVAARWSRQEEFRPLVEQWAGGYGIDPALALALVAQESGFDPRAYREEPHIDDASYGLGQILYRTAQGEGYQGAPDGLFDPGTNLRFSFKYFRWALDRTGNQVDAALSTYNGGYRPSSGYGAKLRTGEFRNQAYVDGVLLKARYFREYLAERGGPAAAAGLPFGSASGSSAPPSPVAGGAAPANPQPKGPPAMPKTPNLVKLALGLVVTVAACLNGGGDVLRCLLAAAGTPEGQAGVGLGLVAAGGGHAAIAAFRDQGRNKAE